SIVMVNASSGSPQVVESVPLDQERVYLRVTGDFLNRADKARFAYSLDGEEWTEIGNELKMEYLLSHFMGYRFALFNFGTSSTGGYVDFDFFDVSECRPSGAEPRERGAATCLRAGRRPRAVFGDEDPHVDAFVTPSAGHLLFTRPALHCWVGPSG